MVGLLVLLVMIYAGLLEVSTAANTVPSSRAGVAILPVDAEGLKPEECAGFRLNAVVRGAGSIKGTKKDDLILGSTAIDDIEGREGDDCLIGGGGNDALDGGGGDDVCIGGPGLDTFQRCAVEIQ